MGGYPVFMGTIFHDDAFLWGNYLYRTTERKFTKGACNDPSPPETVMFWLQPGGQRVGDQLFDAFAYSEEKHECVTSWRVDAKAV
jgi:hypothetical protein